MNFVQKKTYMELVIYRKMYIHALADLEGGYGGGFSLIRLII